MKKITLDRMLQSQGFGTRKYCRQLIAEGELSIDGEVVTDYRQEVELSDLQFRLFDEEWLYREHVYIALNKPSGIECSRKPSNHPGVMTLLPEQFSWRDVQAIGRLDHDTTGYYYFPMMAHLITPCPRPKGMFPSYISQPPLNPPLKN